MTTQALSSALLAQQRFFQSGATRPLAARAAALRRLQESLRRHRADLCEAVRADLGRSPFDTLTAELYGVERELAQALRELGRWAAPRAVSPELLCRPGRAMVRPEPLGRVLILSPWNYPLLLALSPLVGALAAGNCAVVRPSSRMPQTCRALCTLLEEAFSPELVLAAPGSHALGDWLLEQPFDLIFFTGSAEVGRRVLRAAAAHLTPVVLELGGKSPCIVDESADLAAAARRIVWAKFFNAGQTCVAPDYLLVARPVAPALLEEIERCVKRFYYRGGALSAAFPRLIGPGKLEELLRLIEREMVVLGGAADREACRLEPTVLCPVTPDAPCMEAELFGPVLPVVLFDSLDEAVAVVNARPKPLALYHFSRSRTSIAYVLNNTSAGGGCVNEAVLQVSDGRLPFGGVGASGMGRYHGRASFDTFSNLRSLLVRRPRLELPGRYPPHFGLKQALFERLLMR